MANQNWLWWDVEREGRVFRVKLNVDAKDLLLGRGLGLRMREDGYPWVIQPGPAPELDRFLAPLHVFVIVEKNGPIEPEPNGRPRVVHHRNGDKLDARLKNLVVTTQSLHARHHNSKRRKHAYRKRQDLGGLYRPRQPAQVKAIPVTEELKNSISSPRQLAHPKSLIDRVRDLEDLLTMQWPFVLSGTAYLEGEGRAIPRTASPGEWRKPQTRLLGLHMPRMACSDSEACFVRLYVSFGLDLERVADDLGESLELLRVLLKRVPVSVAIERWLKYRRLPTKTAQFGHEEVVLQPGLTRRRKLLPTPQP